MDDIVPVVEPLTAPEGDLRRALDDILQLQVGLYDSRTPAIIVEVKTDLFVDAVEKLEGKFEPGIHHVGIIPKHVFQDRTRFNIEVVFVAKTLCFPKADVRGIEIERLAHPICGKASAGAK